MLPAKALKGLLQVQMHVSCGLKQNIKVVKFSIRSDDTSVIVIYHCYPVPIIYAVMFVTTATRLP